MRNPIKFYLHTSKSRSYRSKPTGIQTLKNRDLSAPNGMSPRSLVLFFLFGSFFFRFFLVQILVLKILKVKRTKTASFVLYRRLKSVKIEKTLIDGKKQETVGNYEHLRYLK